MVFPDTSCPYIYLVQPFVQIWQYMQQHMRRVWSMCDQDLAHCPLWAGEHAHVCNFVHVICRAWCDLWSKLVFSFGESVVGLGPSVFQPDTCQRLQEVCPSWRHLATAVWSSRIHMVVLSESVSLLRLGVNTKHRKVQDDTCPLSVVPKLNIAFSNSFPCWILRMTPKADIPGPPKCWPVHTSLPKSTVYWPLLLWKDHHPFLWT